LIMAEQIPKKYRELRELLVEALDSLIEKEAEKLKKATARNSGLSVGNNEDAVELFVAAGLMSYVGDYGSMSHSDYLYESTEKGRDVYARIINFKKAEND
jgi:hypothetical protein